MSRTVRRRRLRSVLVANRGEIAVRVVRTLHALGLRALVVYSEVDERSLAVELADDAVAIGPASAAESYLSIERITAAARRLGADAVHPGYGFLSEREAFASAVEEAGLVFLGPTPENVRVLGDKLEARKAMARAGIGPVPGSEKGLRDVRAARRFAAGAGYPVLLKAAAGGGGKGIRVVRREEDLEAAFRLAASEAHSSFGSGLLFAERYLEGARHVEVQVLGDGEGGVRLFWERECSIQRRLQKLVEETPSPAVGPQERVRLLEAAARLVREQRYRSAGTLEFLLAADGSLYFLEMNTRIQVEHPVTEVTAGVDLVALQIAVAEGERFDATELEDLVTAPRGAAIELRVNAEDPADDFRPSSGRIGALRLPQGPGIRVDTALMPGLEVTPYYDPLLAKVVAHGEDRRQALGRLRGALEELVVGGVATTLPVGLALLWDRSFLAGRYHCQFLAERLEDERFLSGRSSRGEVTRAAAVLALLAQGDAEPAAKPAVAAALSPWRLAGRGPREGGALETWESFG